VIAAFLRIWQLTLKPLHHDEAINGYFLLGLFREAIYRYNAANYHGPTLYYFALISSSINNLLFNVEGPTTWAISNFSEFAVASILDRPPANLAVDLPPLCRESPSIEGAPMDLPK
jgi:hypothetical protein